MSFAAGTKSETDMRTFQGKVLAGRYHLEEFIAEGNFGAVFRSQQMFMERPARRVAVKLSKDTGIGGDEARELFADVFVLAQAMDEMRDAVARSRLVHVYDAGLAGEADNRAFVVMEYVQGTTLQAQFRFRDRVTAAQLLIWARQIAEAIRGLHSMARPLVHRDLKPDNILLGMDNAVRVVDFGLTARLNDRGKVSGKAGTFTYMAPETACGESGPASDIYSIGMVLYEGLTGQLPFDHLVPPLKFSPKEQNEWLRQQKERILVDPPSRLNQTVGKALDQLVLKCLAFSPSQRFQDGAELLAALDQLERPEPVSQDAAALDDARRLQQAGDLPGAMAACQRGLAVAQPRREIHADLLKLLSGLHEQAGRSADEVQTLMRLWTLVKESGALLPKAVERAALLDRIAELHRKVGNSYQADKFAGERRTRFPQVPSIAQCRVPNMAQPTGKVSSR